MSPPSRKNRGDKKPAKDANGDKNSANGDKKSARDANGDKRSATDFSADGSVNQPYGGPMWILPEADKDGRVGRPVQATQAMYGTPGPGRYEFPVIPDAPESTMKRAPRWIIGVDLKGDSIGSLGVGPSGYDQDGHMTNKGREDGRHYTIYKQFPPLRQFIPPPPYDPTEPSVMKHHVSVYPREPYWTIREDYLTRVGKYVPGPNNYPIVRFPLPQIEKTPQKGADAVVAHKPNLIGPYVPPPGPTNYKLPDFALTRLRSHAPAFSMRGRGEGKLKHRSPGPAAYPPRSLDTIKKRTPAYSMGIDGSANAGSFIETFGKPGRPGKNQSKICRVPPKHGGFAYGKDV